MIALYVIGGILLFLFLLLIIPVSVEAGYTDSFILRLRYGGIKVFDTGKQKKPKKPRKPKKPKPEGKGEKKPVKPKKDGFVKKIFRDHGKIGGIKFIFSVLKAGLSKAVWVIKKIKFKKLLLDITVSSEDAAATAVSYGGVCAAVYPVIALIKENTCVAVSEVNIRTDFDKLSPEIKAITAVRTRLIYAAVAAISLLFAYFKIKKESVKNER